MKITFPKYHSHLKKPDRFNPHRYWIMVLCISVVILIAELCYFSWYFLHTTKNLDAPVLPIIETNATKIKSMERKLETIEQSIKNRVGEENWNTSEVRSQ